MNRLGCLTLWIALFLVLAVPVLFYAAVETALGKLGISPDLAIVYFLAMLAGSAINIPIWKRPAPGYVRLDPLAIYGLDGLLPDRIGFSRETVISVNVGGCIIPLLIAAYQIVRLAGSENPLSALLAIIIATSLNVLVCWRLARPMSGIGIALPGLIPPLVAAAAALLLQSKQAPPVAFVAGVLGPLIGADLLHLRDLKSHSIAHASIGGAGTFDGIVLSGVIATLLA